jgi:two-component system, NarL family, sensor histidine kinase DesK
VWTGITIGGIAFFIALFWTTMRRAERGAAPGVRTHLLLAAQAFLALVINQELLYLLAMELPLVLPLRIALGWSIGSLLTLTGTIVATATLARDSFVPSPNLAHLPYVGQVALTGVTMSAWYAFAFSGGCLAAIERRNRRELARVNAEMSAAQQLLAHNSRLAERLHIARELHDALGHHLTALRLHLELARRLAPNTTVSGPLGQAHDIASAMLADVRRVVSSMREDRPFELGVALRRMVDGVVEPAVSLTMPDDLIVEDAAHAHVLFRAVQEAITNAIRHANATRVWIDLVAQGDAIELAIRDDGFGTDEIDEGSGLTGMRERVRDLGGALRIDSRPGGGFSLHVSLPLAGATA